MRYYEILYIVNPNFERKKIHETMKEIESRLKKTKSKIINHIIWGKKKLAYSMQGHKYGTYILVHYNAADKDTLNEFDSWLKLSNLVIRHMIIRLDNEPNVLDNVDDESLRVEEKEQLKSDKNEESNDGKKELSEKNNDEETEGVE